jgi:hypothetical protein
MSVGEEPILSATIRFAIPLQKRGAGPAPYFDEIVVVVNKDETVTLRFVKITPDGLFATTGFEGYALTNIRDPMKLTRSMMMALNIDRFEGDPKL